MTPARSLAPPLPRWEVAEPPAPEIVATLRGELHLPDPLCRVLAVRGLTESRLAREHLRPRMEDLSPPGELRDAEVAAERIGRAIAEGEMILVHGDYDVDGVCAAALYTRVLRRLGGRVEAFVPSRLRDGYDFGEAGVARATEVGATLVVTADCGVVAHDAVREAAARGIDVIVTDHHTPAETLPPAVAVVDPAREDDPWEGPAPCGAGVAFKVASLVAAEHGLGLDEMGWYLDLVALATVADLVPLAGENRILARYGLRVLRRTRNPGLRALLAVTGLAGKEINAGRVGFGLAPRINAAGRVGEAGDALRLLLTDDPEEAGRLAERLDELNRVRKEADRRTHEEALEMLEREYDPGRDFGVVLASEGWHPGVIGIVASRVVERIHRPTVLVALEGSGGRGSARSIPGFDLLDAVRSCAPHLRRFGGHRQAAGMDVDRDALPAFRDAFRRAAASALEGSDLLHPRVRADLESPLEGLDLPLADVMRHLGPHGIGNPRPVFLARDVEVAGSRTVGEGHLKLRLRRGSEAPLEAIGFGLAERHAETALPGARVDVLFHLLPNEYRGRRTAQARLVDLRPAGDG